MVSFMNSAIAANASGIAIPVINATGFTAPVKRAMDAGIPVLSYNADGTVASSGVPNIGTNRLAYIGQALYQSGQQLGQRILSLIPGGGHVGDLHRHPGHREHPAALRRCRGRAEGVGQELPGGPDRDRRGDQRRARAEKAYLLAHKSTLKGAFAVDAGSTGFLGQALTGTGLKIPAGGFDLTPRR